MTFEEFLEEWRDVEPEITAHTSGSTGTPKEIRLRKEFVRASARRTNSFFHIDSGSRLHSCVAADFIGGKMMAVRSEEAGCRLTWETPSNRPLEGLGAGERIDLLAVVPSQMLHILDRLETPSEQTSSEQTSSEQTPSGQTPEKATSGVPLLLNIIIGGSAIDPRLRQRIIESGLNAYETYGMTETASHIALRKIGEGCEWFETLPGITVSCDRRGCLVIQIPSAAGEGVEVITNDIAKLDGSRRFKILGRADHVIVTGGKKVNPMEVEMKIAEVMASWVEKGTKEVGAYRITSRPDEKWGQRVVLEIETGAGETGAAVVQPDYGSLLSRLRGELPAWEVPKEVIPVSELPRTPNGKIRH